MPYPNNLMSNPKTLSSRPTEASGGTLCFQCSSPLSSLTYSWDITLDLRIEIKESFQAGLQLLFDLFFAAFQHVHGDVRVAAALQLYSRIAHFGHFVGGQEPHAIN